LLRALAVAHTTIFLCAGDESGDLHASNLMRAVRERAPDTRFVGLGLRRMVDAGLESLVAADLHPGHIGLHNTLRLLEHRRRRELCRAFLREHRPDLVLLVDYGGFNLYLARIATHLGIPVLYYILPQVWAHGRYRLKKIKKWVTKCLVIYPFEPELYRRYGVEAQYVGHPLFDEIERDPPDEERVRELRGSGQERLVALFPGSRPHEVRANLPIMLQAGARIRQRFPDVRFATVCPPAVRPALDATLKNRELAVALPQVRPLELARASSLCLTKSGTVTLEVGSQIRPMIIFYRVNAFFYFFARGMGQTPYFGLVNTLAGRMICPELVMWRDDPHWVVRHAAELLGDAGRYEQCQSDLRAVMEDFARPGASARAAEVAVEMAQGRP